jgi:hypothetical protein
MTSLALVLVDVPGPVCDVDGELIVELPVDDLLRSGGDAPRPARASRPSSRLDRAAARR